MRAYEAGLKETGLPWSRANRGGRVAREGLEHDGEAISAAVELHRVGRKTEPEGAEGQEAPQKYVIQITCGGEWCHCHGVYLP